MSAKIEGAYKDEVVRATLEAMTNAGFRQESAPMIPNIAGIRRTDKVDAFDDLFVLWRQRDGLLESLVFRGTTDPGMRALKNPSNKGGTFILKDDAQHKKMWAVGKHKGHDALVQVSRVVGWRDADRDSELDIDQGKLFDDAAGINFHSRYSSPLETGVSIGGWSYGCQVPASVVDHAEAMEWFHKADILSIVRRFDYSLFKWATVFKQ